MEAAGEDFLSNLTSKGFENVTAIVKRFKEIYPIELWIENGFFNQDYLDRINLHWMKFDPPSQTSHYVLAVLYIILLIVGVSGNALVVFMFIRCKSLRTPANTLVINLAISDFFMMIKMPVFIYNSFYFGPALGDISCKIYGFLGGLTGTVSICSLAFISLDRYYVIKYPLNRRFTELRAKICIMIAWTYGAAFATIPVLDIGLGTYVPEGYLTSCSFDYLTPHKNIKYFILSFFFAAWVIPFTLITFCYINIVLVVIKSKNITKADAVSKESSRHIKEEEKRRQEFHLALLVLSVIGLWFAAWTPYATIALLGISGKGVSPITSMIPALFCKTASCVDPFIYALTHPKFKAELKSMFCKDLTRANTMKVFSIRSQHESKKEQLQKKVSVDSNTSEEVVEEMVVVNLKKDLNKMVPSRKSSNRSQVQPSEPDRIMSDNEMKKQNKNFNPSWWYRPSFSNRSSSVRNLARTWTTKSRKSNDPNDEEMEQKSF